MTNYLAIDREQIWAALFAHLQTKVGSLFVSMGRRHIAPPQLPLASQPALFMIQAKETHKPKGGLPVAITLKGFLIIYVPAPVVNEQIGTETVLAATVLNQIFQALDAAFLPDVNSGFFTLRGLVQHCWFEGDTDQDPGIFGPQAAAILPINILTP